MNKLEKGTQNYEQSTKAWQDMGNAMRNSENSHNFYLAASAVLAVTLPTVDSRLAFLDQLETDYFPEGVNNRYFKTLRGQIDVDGPASICASEMTSRFVSFGAPCNYALIGYVSEKWDELKADKKIIPTPDMEKAVGVIYELAKKVEFVPTDK